jgi:hypothetical protein
MQKDLISRRSSHGNGQTLKTRQAPHQSQTPIQGLNPAYAASPKAHRGSLTKIETVSARRVQPSQSQNHSHIRRRASWMVRSRGCSGVPVWRFAERHRIGLYQAAFLCSREPAQYQRTSRVHRELSWPLHPRQAGQRHPSLVYLKPVLELLYRARIIFHAPNLHVVACLVKGIPNSF